MRSIVCSGFVALDTVRFEEYEWHRAGGTAANIAANLAFLGWTAKLLGEVGADLIGLRLKADLETAGVDVSDLMVSPQSATPRVIHEVGHFGHRFRFFCAVCGRRFPRYRPPSSTLVPGVLATVSTPDFYFFDRASTFSVAVAEDMRRRGVTVIFEPSTKGGQVLLRRAVECAHILKVSEERLAVVRHLMRSGQDGQIQIVTRGEAGLLLSLRGETVEVPAFPAKAVDAGGAGDWVTAGLLAYLPSSKTSAFLSDIAKALRYGQAFAALNCGFVGARTMTFLRSREEVVGEVERMIRSRVTPESGGESYLTDSEGCRDRMCNCDRASGAIASR